MHASAGALFKTRGDEAPHAGQGNGSRNAAIGFRAVKSPHPLHAYS
jgi:hypothetical protein